MNQNKIDQYITLLKDYNKHTNIYSSSAYDKLPFHINDSLNIADLIKNESVNILDIGSGSGFPSIIISIFNDKNKIYAVESKQKKCRFLEIVKKELCLNNYTVINDDIRNVIKKHLVKPHFVTAKAFGALDDIKTLLKPIGALNSVLIVPLSQKQRVLLNTYSDNDFILRQTVDVQYYYYFKKI